MSILVFDQFVLYCSENMCTVNWAHCCHQYCLNNDLFYHRSAKDNCEITCFWCCFQFAQHSRKIKKICSMHASTIYPKSSGRALSPAKSPPPEEFPGICSGIMFPPGLLPYSWARSSYICQKHSIWRCPGGILTRCWKHITWLVSPWQSGNPPAFWLSSILLIFEMIHWQMGLWSLELSSGLRLCRCLLTDNKDNETGTHTMIYVSKLDSFNWYSMPDLVHLYLQRVRRGELRCFDFAFGNANFLLIVLLKWYNAII